MSLPPFFEAPPDGNNPAVLSANLALFEAMLDAHPAARVVWAHVGWDNTGDATADRVRVLLEAHDNLFASFKLLDTPGPVQVPENRPLDEQGALRPEWLALIEDFGDRFVPGSDEFVSGVDAPGAPSSPSTRGTFSLVAALPADLARRIACDNPRALYRLQR